MFLYGTGSPTSTIFMALVILVTGCIPPKMKQGAKKRPADSMKNDENSDKTNPSERRFSVKRRKMSNSDEKSTEKVTKGNEKRWSAVETEVQPEILEDMGVKILEDEENTCNENKKPIPDSKSGSPLRSVTNTKVSVPNTNTENRLQAYKEDQRNASINEEFFLFRRKQSLHTKGEDVFSKLSDEMVLMIFRSLPKNMLVRCSLVCKRWQRIAYDEVLWTRMDLASKSLKPGSLGHLLTRGTSILRLAQAEVADPVFFNCCPLLSYDIHCKLQYLDLSMAVISEQGLADLLGVCRNIRKLSLEHCTVNDTVCSAIEQNQNLEILNLTLCYGITQSSVKSILNGCRKLIALNMAWTNLSVGALDILCSELPQTLQRINISGCRKTLNDIHVEHLVDSCPGLVELDLSDCTTITAKSVESIISGLEKIEYLAFSRCYSIAPQAYTRLKAANSLMYLDVFNLMNEVALASVQQSLPDVDVNKFLFSSVARPTVGIRRTSIWGLRVRD